MFFERRLEYIIYMIDVCHNKDNVILKIKNINSLNWQPALFLGIKYSLAKVRSVRYSRSISKNIASIQNVA